MSTEETHPNYWKSLNELAENEEYKKFLHREFPENASELSSDVSRRSFLRIMGASIALAGFAACRRPVQKILPYTKQPEDIVQGEPIYYASAMPFQDVLTGLVVEAHEGRPTKVEGNTEHPSSHGNTNIYGQAAILNLYDPDRSHYPRKGGQRSSWNDFVSFCSQHFSDTNRNIAFISEANSSPTYNGIKQKVLDKFSNATWVTYEPFGEDNRIEGTQLAFGQRLRTKNHYDKAKVVVSLDDDFMNPSENKNSVEDIYNFSQARRVRSTEDEMNRLYMVESTFSLTGSNADNRLPLKASELDKLIYNLAAELSGHVSGLEAFSGYNANFSDNERVHDWINSLVEELIEHKGEAIVSAGYEHAPEVHSTIAAINVALQNAGNTVTYHDVPHFDDQNNREAFASVVNDMKAGQYDTVVMVGTNPVFTAPADLDFASALENVDQSIHLSQYVNETSDKVNWHVNRAHFLEAWGDGYSFSGTRSVVQPLISPLFSGKSEIEFLNAIAEGKNASGHDLVQQTWQGYYSNGFHDKWRKILHDGVDTGGHFEAVTPSLDSNFTSKAKQFTTSESGNNGIELVIRPDSQLFDGRFSNNGWLQELPEPITKLTWDNVALMSVNTAKKLGVDSERKINVKTDNGELKIVVWVQPGHADNSITIMAGQGRKKSGRVGNDNGVDAYPLRTTSNMFYHSDISVSKTGEFYALACTQDHQSMEGRALIREASLDEYRENPGYSSYEEAYHGAELPGEKEAKAAGEDFPIPLFDALNYPDYEPQWGMSIDLNACIGCGVCTIACQAENNIPVIGKKDVREGREMHWIRTDRYYKGDTTDNPEAVHQPVPCMQCELAPCEEVCPVAATTHSDDGMNQMTYNRCIGTRYCLNNCPYKVRRFNFFNFSKDFLTSGSDPEIVQMAMNPDVTIRFRGVMEKCTYCAQRTNHAKIKTKQKTGHSIKPPDGMVETACQQACPADAITFGDLTDNNSIVSTDKMNERTYLLLEELNTRPRTSYMAKLRNPNPNLA